jgi:TldD protein
MEVGKSSRHGRHATPVLPKSCARPRRRLASAKRSGSASRPVDLLAGGTRGLPDLGTLLPNDALDELIKAALSKGGQFAEVYAEYAIDSSFELDEQKLKNVVYGIRQGVGIRVISGERTGYAYADHFDLEELKEVASVAARIVREEAQTEPVPVRTRDFQPPFVLRNPAPLGSTEAVKIERMFRADQAARDYDRRIRQVSVGYGDEAKAILVANSEGLMVEDRQYVSRLRVVPLAVEGSARQSSRRDAGGSVDEDYFDKVSPESLGREAAAEAVKLLSASDAKAGSYPVVVGPGWGGVLVHECFGHTLEADAVRKGTSLRATQMGARVASDNVTIVDSALVPFSRGSFKVDDEGTPAQKHVVVENGVLTGYLYDKLNAKLMGAESTGNGRRQSYRHYPLPRMTNTYIDSGDCTPEEIIASTKSGLYCKMLGGGSVNPASGNFSFRVTLAYLIEDGKITAPVKGVTLTGNGADAMMRISMVADDLDINGMTGTCGKGGQSKAVGVGQPTVKFSELTVGGTGV